MKKLLFENAGIAECDMRSAVDWHRQSLPSYDVQESPERTVFSYSGGWWYRGETTLEPDPRGVRVTFQVFNVAPRRHWMVPPANKYFLTAQEQYAQGFADGLRQLADDLGISAYALARDA